MENTKTTATGKAVEKHQAVEQDAEAARITWVNSAEVYENRDKKMEEIASTLANKQLALEVEIMGALGFDLDSHDGWNHRDPSGPMIEQRIKFANGKLVRTLTWINAIGSGHRTFKIFGNLIKFIVSQEAN